jgi:hypothetical protein
MIRVRERLFAAPHFGRSGGTRRCPLSGVKRTSQECTGLMTQGGSRPARFAVTHNSHDDEVASVVYFASASASWSVNLDPVKRESAIIRSGFLRCWCLAALAALMPPWR